MALRNLVARMRTPAAAALRLPPPPPPLSAFLRRRRRRRRDRHRASRLLAQGSTAPLSLSIMISVVDFPTYGYASVTIGPYGYLVLVDKMLLQSLRHVETPVRLDFTRSGKHSKGIDLESASIEEIRRQADLVGKEIDEALERTNLCREEVPVIWKDIWGSMRLWLVAGAGIELLLFADSRLRPRPEVEAET